MLEFNRDSAKLILQKKEPFSYTDIESLREYFCSSARNETASLLSEFYESDLANGYKIPLNKTQEIWENITSNITASSLARKKYNARRYMYAAAVLSALLLIASFWVFSNKENSLSKKTDAACNEHNLPPGKNGAVLTLADGRQMTLDATGNGIIIGKDGSAIKKTKDRGLVYDKGLGAGYNKLETSVGRTFNVVLSDGSKIALNASSSLEYPMEFNGPERTVFVSGEAYFEIAHDAAHPFVVHVKNENKESSSIKVLGTHFDIKAYANDTCEETTLCEGSIQYQSGSYAAVLKPGHQLQKNGRNANVNINIKKIDVEDVIAWIKGDFSFNHVPLQEIMKQIDRWYGTETVYKSDVTDMVFCGFISRNKDLKSVMKILELEGIHYQLNNKQIIIE